MHSTSSYGRSEVFHGFSPPMVNSYLASLQPQPGRASVIELGNTWGWEEMKRFPAAEAAVGYLKTHMSRSHGFAHGFPMACSQENPYLWERGVKYDVCMLTCGGQNTQNAMTDPA